MNLIARRTKAQGNDQFELGLIRLFRLTFKGRGESDGFQLIAAMHEAKRRSGFGKGDFDSFRFPIRWSNSPTFPEFMRRRDCF
jgi:hypothetical protein